MATTKRVPLTFKKAVRDCITENDGDTVCPFRVCGMLMSFVGISVFGAAAVVMLVNNKQLDFEQLGIGFASMTSSLAILAGGIAIKATTDTGSDGSAMPKISFTRKVNKDADKTIQAAGETETNDSSR